MPSDDAALIAWHDASDAATITGLSTVSAWADKVSGGADLAQGTGGARPVTGTRTQNGLNVLDFDGGDYLARSVTLPASGDVALHMALIIDGAASEYAAVLALDATNDMQIDAASATQFDGRFNAAGIGSSFGLSGGPFSGPVILSVVFDQTGSGTAEVFIGNVSRGVTSYTTALDAAMSLYVMSNRSTNAEVDGAVCELAITGTTGNRAAYHAYLANKWGVA